jgi:hypothetical protein
MHRTPPAGIIVGLRHNVPPAVLPPAWDGAVRRSVARLNVLALTGSVPSSRDGSRAVSSTGGGSGAGGRSMLNGKTTSTMASGGGRHGVPAAVTSQQQQQQHLGPQLLVQELAMPGSWDLGMVPGYVPSVPPHAQGMRGGGSGGIKVAAHQERPQQQQHVHHHGGDLYQQPDREAQVVMLVPEAAKARAEAAFERHFVR